MAPAAHIHIGHTFFGAGNMGDDLVMAGFLRGISQCDTPLRITAAISFDIASQRRRFPQVEWYRYDASARAALIGGCDAWVGLGGPLFQRHEDGWLLPDQVAQIELCRRAGKPVFFLGCGVDFRTDAHRQDIRFILNSASWIWTRDGLSAEALRNMQFRRGSCGADMSHIVLAECPPRALEPQVAGFICNFEERGHYSVEAIAALLDAADALGLRPRWLVQEVRRLTGSEEFLLRKLPRTRRRTLDVGRPDYAAGSIAELLAAWGAPELFFSTRFHGAIVGAWLGSRVVAFEREQKIKGIARDLGFESFAALPEGEVFLRAVQNARPISRTVLNDAAQRARQSCIAFTTSVLSQRRPPA